MEYNNEHRAYFGCTGSGKTYHAFKDYKNSKIPVIYYNYKNQDMEVIENYKTLNYKNTFAELEYCLRNYNFVNFLASEKAERRKQEIERICDYLLHHKTLKKVVFVVDEAPMVVPEGDKNNAIIEVARIGRSKGAVLCVISQRMAGLSKEVITQIEDLYIHELKEHDFNYLKNIGYPSEKIKSLLATAPKYSYIHLKGNNVELCRAKN